MVSFPEEFFDGRGFLSSGREVGSWRYGTGDQISFSTPKWNKYPLLLTLSVIKL
jgi:hypothetical protein